jgi:hypothetical protein
VLRESLRRRLPRSPLQQMVSSDVIMHSTLARLLKLPPGRSAAALTAQLTHAAQEMSYHLCGLSVRLPQVRRRQRQANSCHASITPVASQPLFRGREGVEQLRDAGVERSRGRCAWVSADEAWRGGLSWFG